MPIRAEIPFELSAGDCRMKKERTQKSGTSHSRTNAWPIFEPELPTGSLSSALAMSMTSSAANKLPMSFAKNVDSMSFSGVERSCRIRERSAVCFDGGGPV